MKKEDIEFAIKTSLETINERGNYDIIIVVRNGEVARIETKSKF